MTTGPYVFHSRARTPRAMLTLGLLYLLLVGAWLWLDAALWIIVLIFVFSLPALWDMIANPASGLTLDDTAVSWHTGKREAQVPREEIDHLRLDTRLDFSVRATLVLGTGRKVRLPFEATPPVQPLVAACEDHALPIKRFHFQLMQ